MKGDSGSQSGTVLTLSPDYLAQIPPQLSPDAFGVQTGRGILAVITAQRAGRRALAASELLRGLRHFIGGRLDMPPEQ